MTAARSDLMASERAGSLRGLANGIEKSLAAYGHVTLSNEDWEDVVSALRLAASQPDREAVLSTLREHHNWHLQAGTIGLQDGEGGWIEIDNGAEYSDSALYERTAKLLEGAPPEELQPIPRGGMNTWWWEQAVLLRREVRKLKALLSGAGTKSDGDCS